MQRSAYLGIVLILFTAMLTPATGCKQPAQKNDPSPSPDPLAGKKDPPKKSPDDKAIPGEVVDAWSAAKGHAAWMRAHRGYASTRFAFGVEAEPGEIHAFSFSAESWKNVTLSKLPEPPVPFGIDLSGEGEVSAAALKDLARFKNLRGLGLARTSIKDYKALGQLSSLRWLDLTGCMVEDAHLKDLSALKSLQLLNVGTSKVSNAGLKELAGMTDLQALDLHRSNITDDGLKELTGFKKLKVLNLSSVLGESKITDAGVKTVAALDLHTLFLNGTQATDAGVKELAACKNLQVLWLNGNNVTDASAPTLAGLAELNEINLGFTAIGDDTVKALAGLKKLRMLSLGNTKTTDASLKALAGAKTLRELYLSDKTTEAGVAELQKALPECKIVR